MAQNEAAIKNAEPFETTVPQNSPVVKSSEEKPPSGTNQYMQNSEKDTRQMSIKDASAAGTDNIGTFDESNPDIRYSVKDDKKKRSEFYENTAKRATAIPQEVKEKLNPESFDFIPESSIQWQAQAEKNVKNTIEPSHCVSKRS